jgi:hypothetical protein
MDVKSDPRLSDEPEVCATCGHVLDGAVTYYEDEYGRNWKTFWDVCHTCRVGWSTYAGTSVFSHAETGPGFDFTGWNPPPEWHDD